MCFLSINFDKMIIDRLVGVKVNEKAIVLIGLSQAWQRENGLGKCIGSALMHKAHPLRSKTLTRVISDSFGVIKPLDRLKPKIS